MPELTIDSRFELFPNESGETWKVEQDFTVEDERGRKLTITKGFVHDRYSVAPDLPDRDPAVAHDFAYRRKRWDNGIRMTRKDANRLLLYRMQKSPSRTTRVAAGAYYAVVRLLGWSRW